MWPSRCFQDRLANAIDIADYGVIPEPQCLESGSLEMGIPAPVSRVLGILAAIHFDNIIV